MSDLRVTNPCATGVADDREVAAPADKVISITYDPPKVVPKKALGCCVSRGTLAIFSAVLVFVLILIGSAATVYYCLHAKSPHSSQVYVTTIDVELSMQDGSRRTVHTALDVNQASWHFVADNDAGGGCTHTLHHNGVRYSFSSPHCAFIASDATECTSFLEDVEGVPASPVSTDTHELLTALPNSTASSPAARELTSSQPFEPPVVCAFAKPTRSNSTEASLPAAEKTLIESQLVEKQFHTDQTDENGRLRVVLARDLAQTALTTTHPPEAFWWFVPLIIKVVVKTVAAATAATTLTVGHIQAATRPDSLTPGRMGSRCWVPRNTILFRKKLAEGETRDYQYIRSPTHDYLTEANYNWNSFVLKDYNWDRCSTGFSCKDEEASKCCNLHDICYATFGNTHEECENDFRQCMFANAANCYYNSVVTNTREGDFEWVQNRYRENKCEGAERRAGELSQLDYTVHDNAYCSPGSYADWSNIPIGPANLAYTHGTEAEAKAACDAEPTCEGFTYRKGDSNYILKNRVNGPSGSSSGYKCFKKPWASEQ